MLAWSVALLFGTLFQIAAAWDMKDILQESELRRRGAGATAYACSFDKTGATISLTSGDTTVPAGTYSVTTTCGLNSATQLSVTIGQGTVTINIPAGGAVFDNVRFAVPTGAILTIKGAGTATFRNNNAVSGGAISVTGGTFNLQAPSIFDSNVATTTGGAIFVTGGTLAISTPGATATFSGNSATTGGAISITGNGIVTTKDAAVTFSSNSAASGGGAISVTGGSLTISGAASLNSNSATTGGAISVGSGGSLTITGDSTFSSNTAVTGGAITNAGTTTISAGTPTFSNNVVSLGIYGTTAAEGGAIYNTGTLSLTGPTFTSNTADAKYAHGGALYNSGTVTLSGTSAFNTNKTKCSVAASMEGYGGAIYTNGGTVKTNAGPDKYTFNGNTVVGTAGLSGGAIYATKKQEITCYNSNFLTSTCATFPGCVAPGNGATTVTNTYSAANGGSNICTI